MAYCPMTLKRRLPLEGKPLNFTTMSSQEHCIAGHMMKSSSTAYHIKRHRKRSKRLITLCAELTNLVQKLRIDFEDWDIIDQRWFLMPSLILSDAMPIRSMVTSFTRHQDIFALQLLPGHQNVGNRRGWSYQPTFIQRILVYLSHNQLLLQMGGG